MALVLVVPVNDVHRSIGTIPEIQHLAPRVVGFQEVGTVGGRIPGTRALQPIHVGAGAVNVVHEDRVAVFLRPVVPSEIDHRAGVRVTAASRIGSAVARVRTLVADPVHVVSNGLDVVVDVRVDVLARLAFVSPALHDLVQVLDHARRHKRMPVVVEVQPPRIAGALGKYLERVRDRMEAPHSRVELDSFGLGSACFPTFDWVNTPWVPYNQPSGPQVKVFNVSWVSSYPQPSSMICGGPAG